MEFIEGCNTIIAGTMKADSNRLIEIDLPTANQCSSAEFEIRYTLLQDIILMEVCSYNMRFVAEMKRKNRQEKKSLEDRIEMIHNSEDMKDDNEVEELKQKVEDINDK